MTIMKGEKGRKNERKINYTAEAWALTNLFFEKHIIFFKAWLIWTGDEL